MPDKYFDVDGVATLVHHRGETTLPGAPPLLANGSTVLLFHDAGGNGNCFRELMDCLESNHSPVSFDQPGHGRSGELDSLTSIEAMAVHAETLVKNWEPGELVLVGEGMGAAVAIEVANRAKVNVAGIVCVGSSGKSVDLTEEIEQLALIAAGKARRQFDSTGYSPNTDEGVFRTAFTEWVKTDPRATVGARRAQQKWNSDADISKVATPVLVVIGEHTEAEYQDSAQEFADALPNGTATHLEGASRHAVIENPTKLSAAIDEYVQGLGQRHD